MLVTRLGMAARANIRVMPAKVMTEENAQNGKEQPEQKTPKINILFRGRVHIYVPALIYPAAT